MSYAPFDDAAIGYWQLPTGRTNSICDVEGVRVGHVQNMQGNARTGVTALLPMADNIYANKLPAGCAVINGFGKSAGLVQVPELGEIETPIVFTNTLGVGIASQVLIERAIAENPQIGRNGSATVNPLVFECNDGRVNDIQAIGIDGDLVDAALDQCDTTFAQGTVGAGTGMCTFGFAGGLGSASRKVQIGEQTYTLGSFVLSNFGQRSNIRVFGQNPQKFTDQTPDSPDAGSIIIVMATDLPLDSLQLSRLSLRAAAALGRLGSHYGHHSGDVALAFSTQNARKLNGDDIVVQQRLSDRHADKVFLAGVEATENAILNALWHSEPHEGYDGSLLPSWRDFYERG
ncbi:D-stereospecific aminopeptidase [Maritalea myrionectae]|uniref:D-stereospecific aminopeptidase n=1 Tax=Maritalea myrionectae TaxID=454601 RepID=A0A2R4MCD7_9HYPH|nr:P1 family peptidase [Maritalea myrionectae]AVX03701.1 D-stereospecific aminopeptidase [Maritalea myrionectae]